MQKRSLAVLALVALGALALGAPVLSQGPTPEVQCEAKFKATDKNNDNFITRTEMSDAVPPEFAKESLITRSEFTAACAKTLAAQTQKFDKPAPPSPHSTGLSVSPNDKGQQQPQGPTGPLTTKSGGAPAESPQGQTPPGMQSAPDGSSKTIIDPDVTKPR